MLSWRCIKTLPRTPSPLDPGLQSARLVWMTEAGKIVADALSRQKQAEEKAREVAAEIDAKRGLAETAGVPVSEPAPAGTPERSQ